MVLATGAFNSSHGSIEPGKFMISEHALSKRAYDQAIVPRKCGDKSFEERWPDLKSVLQSDLPKLLFFRQIVKHWFEHEDVNVLARAMDEKALFSRRDYTSYNVHERGKVLGVTISNCLIPRPMFPQAPENFHWGSGRKELKGEPPIKSRLSTKTTLPQPEVPRVNPETGRFNWTRSLGSSTLKKAISRSENVVKSVADRLIEVYRSKRKRPRKQDKSDTTCSRKNQALRKKNNY